MNRILLAVPLLAVAAAAQQRPIHDVSPSLAIHDEARISPDGAYIAYLATGRLAATLVTGGVETTLFQGAGIGDFLWSSNSRNVYFVDGLQVKRVARTGGAPVKLADVPGQSVRLWSVDSTDTLLYGTRYDPATQTYAAFELDTSGTRQPKDLFSTQKLVSEVRIDPSDTYLLYRSQGTQPFDPVNYWRVDKDGSNPVDLSGVLLNFAESAYWLDAGTTIAFDTQLASGSRQIARTSASTGIEALTFVSTHKSPTVRGGWIVMEAIDGPGNGPGIMPVEGGGVIWLYHGVPFSYTGAPTIDAAGKSVVFSAARRTVTENPRLWRVDLDGEMRVYPRAEIGKPLVFELPAFANEVGVIFLGLNSPPFTLPGVSFDFNLGPAFAILLIAQGNASGKISTAVPLPFDPALQGLRIEFQGMRWDPLQQSGEFTRHGSFTIF